MPSSFVKPGQEKYWDRAKTQAAKQGRGDDYAYITGIFKRMTVNKSERFVMVEDVMRSEINAVRRHTGESELEKSVPPVYRMMRTPGQVPSVQNLAILRTMEAVPRPMTTARLMAVRGMYLSPESVVDGLGFDPGQRNEWVRHLNTALGGDNEAVVRQRLYSKLLASGMDPGMRKALFGRALSCYRDMNKSVLVVPLDSLEKAEPKGGKYYRRVQTAKGGYRYYYDEDKYRNSTDVHVDGKDAAGKAIRTGILKKMEDVGDSGCDIKEFQTLVKRYGAKAVGDVMRQACTDGMKFKGGKLYAK